MGLPGHRGLCELEVLSRQEDEDYETGKREMAEYIDRQCGFREAERADACLAVSRAISSYRWWGFTNIINTIRIAIQAWRFRRAKKH